VNIETAGMCRSGMAFADRGLDRVVFDVTIVSPTLRPLGDGM
jgi:hypothetical protein